MLMKIAFVLILWLNGYESTIENRLLSNSYSSMMKPEINQILSTRSNHELIRRSNNKPPIPKKASKKNSGSNAKPKNIKKSGIVLTKKPVPIVPFKIRSNDESSSNKPKNTVPSVVPFETHDNYPLEVIMIHQKKNLIQPYLTKDIPIRVSSLLDYVVKEIIDKDKILNQPNSDSNLLYYDMHSITRLLHSKNELNENDARFITQYGSWKDKMIIMPIKRGENKHVVVLVAKTGLKLLYYFDPVDANMKNENTKKEADEMRKMFVSLLEKRNRKVLPNDRIKLDGWFDKIFGNVWKAENTYSQIPPAPNKNDKNKDFGIHALHYMDMLINGRVSIGRIGDSIDVYFDSVKWKLKDNTDYFQWVEEQEKLDEKQKYLRKWGEM